MQTRYHHEIVGTNGRLSDVLAAIGRTQLRKLPARTADVLRLFDRFWRVEASRSRDYGGSGLGLAIVQAIVRAHDGRVTVQSAPGHGTTVTLHLDSGPPPT
jgi:signal transduction histidine kinase